MLPWSLVVLRLPLSPLSCSAWYDLSIAQQSNSYVTLILHMHHTARCGDTSHCWPVPRPAGSPPSRLPFLLHLVVVVVCCFFTVCYLHHLRHVIR